MSEDELIRRAIEGRLLDVRTSMAATVVSFDANTMRATIKPGVFVQSVDPDTVTPEVDEIADLEEVPVLFPHWGDFIMFAPLKAGDVGRLEWSEEDDAGIYAGESAPTAPVVLKRHGAHAVFRPEGFTGEGALGAENPAHMFLGKPGGACVDTDGDQMALGRSDATDFVMLSQKLLIDLEKIKTDLVAIGVAANGAGVPVTITYTTVTAEAAAKVKAK